MTIDRKSLMMSEIMPPESANFSGFVHGGYLMSMLDRVAYTTATRYCGHYAVTLSVDQILFKQPITVGELVTFYSSINYVGRTSMEVGIKVIAEDIIKAVARHTNTCYFTMVGINEQRQPIVAPQLTPKTQDEKRRFKEAILRKELRLKQAEQQKADKELEKEHTFHINNTDNNKSE